MSSNKVGVGSARCGSDKCASTKVAIQEYSNRSPLIEPVSNGDARDYPPVMPALVAGIYVLRAEEDQRRGWSGQVHRSLREWNNVDYELPMRMPARKTNVPPITTWNAAERNG